MSPLPRALAALLRVNLAAMIQYRAESILWATWGILYPLVATAMWRAAAADPREDAALQTFAQGDFAAYFLLTMVVGHLTAAWDAYEMGYFVRSGAFSGYLMEPLLPMWKSATGNIAYKIFTTAILAPIWLLLAWFMSPRFTTDASHLLLGAISVLLAAGIAFIWGYVVALAAFWTVRTDAIGELWFGASLLFGGRLAPIELLPSPLQWIAFALPHQWALGFPCEALMGRTSLPATLAGVGWQLFWLAGGVVAFRAVWAAALRKYSAVGG